MPVALFVLSVTLPPLQKVAGPPAVINGLEGVVLTVTVVGADELLQPLVATVVV
jgi:hypothetical protein